MERTSTWLNNQRLSLKFYDEFCDMRGLGANGGNHRCPVCKTRRKFVKKKMGDYGFAIMCTTCRQAISPLADTIFGHTKIHLSVWLKAMYILKVRDPEITQKDLAASLNVSLPTVRSIRKRVTKLRKDAFELRVMARTQDLVTENFTFIFNENPKQKSAQIH